MPRARAAIAEKHRTGANAQGRCSLACSTQPPSNKGRRTRCLRPSTGTILTRRGSALARHGAERALDLLEGIAATEAREQSGIWSTASGVLAGYRTDAALASAQGRILDAAELVESRATLYVCAGSDHQRHAAPLVAGLLREVRSAAYQHSLSATVASSDGAWTGTSQASSGPPLLLVLDELANIAPLHDLPTLVAEGGSQGVVTLACLQDLAQARARWDREADGFLSLFGTKLVFPGIGDTRTLEAISLLAGEHEVPTVSVTRGARRGGAARLDEPRRGPSPCARTGSFLSTPSPEDITGVSSASRAPSPASCR